MYDLVSRQTYRVPELFALFKRKRVIEAKPETERKDSDLVEYLTIIDRLIDLL